MSKVGILSMQRIKNYGSFLQAYGLKKIIEELGHEVEFVDYHIEPPVITNSKSNKLSKITKVLKGNVPFIQKIQYIIHKKNFGKKYYKILGLADDYNYTPKLDTLIIGSDEVFNCIQSNENVGYSLELFGKNNKAKKVITYAASFGNTTIKKLEKYNKKQEISELLSKISAISVRDSNSGEIVEAVTNKKVNYNLDPVLIYDYVNRSNKIPDISVKDNFIIVYAYSDRISDVESKVIMNYARKNNLKIYAIGGAQKCADKFIDCSPFEVLGYFKKADFIITDTFHGSIFSIITHRNFVTLVRKSFEDKYGNEEKLIDLLNRLNLQDRAIYDIEDMKKIINKKIMYNTVDDYINISRKETIKYLKNEIV